MKKVHLTREQRYQIDALLQRKTKQKDIARIVGVSPSTISRELKRNSHKRGYSARVAQEYANERKERFSLKRKFTHQMELYVREQLELHQWSPEQIVGRAQVEGREMVSIERIYQCIREDKANGGKLYLNCRHRLKHRKRPVGGGKRVVIPDKVSIHQRPSVIDERARFGDWEVDTIVGSGNKGAILTLVERQTNFLLMTKLKKGKNAKNLANQISNLMLPYKQSVLSITADNGTEFYEHKEIKRRLDTDFYFADPYASYQRGTNENTNGLIRQYIPKNQDFTNINEQKIKQIQQKINARPRKKLNFETPLKLFYQKIALGS